MNLYSKPMNSSYKNTSFLLEYKLALILQKKEVVFSSFGSRIVL